MTLLLSSDLTFFGPALPEAFVQHELEAALAKALPSAKELEPAWKFLHKSLREPLLNAGAVRIRNVVLNSLIKGMGFTTLDQAEPVRTREGDEDGGYLFQGKDGCLRAWAYSYETDLDAPAAQGLNTRFSPHRIAERVLLAANERLGLITNGLELRLIFSDPARRASYASFSLSAWKQLRAYDSLPDAFRLLIAFASPQGQKRLPEVLEQARLKQGQVTKDLRAQARKAIEGFVQSVLDHPTNRESLSAHLASADARAELSKTLWRESLILVYRLLFILRGESGGRETPPFRFASSSLWRNTYSPSHAQPGNLAWAAQKVREEGLETGSFLEDGLRALFRAFEHGVSATELNITPLGGALFGPQSTPLLNGLKWGERGCADMLDNLLRAPRGKGKGRALVRISYRDLDVEDLGRIYEALLELEPGIAGEPMARLKRAKLEVVVPAMQGEKYRPAAPVTIEATDDTEVELEEAEEEEEDSSGKGKKTKIEWIETIPAGAFYLRVGLGRKSSGSYYTPETFVRFLVQETLGPQVDERSPAHDPEPIEILKLNVLDPAMGSGHFLVGACRYVGERLYEACLKCDEQGLVERIPPEVQPYLPSRRPEGESEGGYSALKGKALCKRLVAVHCLYGVDKNPLAVELARVSLWLESFAEDLPLTFLDHRLVCGDSLLGPVNIVNGGPDCPLTPPYANTPLDDALADQIKSRLVERLNVALEKVRALDATLGLDENDLAAKQQAKLELDEALRPLVDLYVAWSGGIMQGEGEADEYGYREAVRRVAKGDWPAKESLSAISVTLSADSLQIYSNNCGLSVGFLTMLAKGRENDVLIYPLIFPEVFFPLSDVNRMAGFDAIIGNPPWDRQEVSEPEFWASFDLRAIEAPSKRDRDLVVKELSENQVNLRKWKEYVAASDEEIRSSKVLYQYQSLSVGGSHTVGRPDVFRLFCERMAFLLSKGAKMGAVVPSAFHANEGTSGIRKLFLDNLALRKCYSFENRRKLFEIDGRFKFAVIVVQNTNPKLLSDSTISTKFYLHDDSWLFSEQKDELLYTADFIKTTGGELLTFVECRTQIDADITYSVFSHSKGNLEDVFLAQEIKLTAGLEVHRAPGFVYAIGDSFDAQFGWNYGKTNSWNKLPLIEGKCFHQYTDCWEPLVRDYVLTEKIITKSHWETSCKYYRLSMRTIASSTNERTIITTILPSAFVANHSVLIETSPSKRPNVNSLFICSVLNSYAFDWLARSRIGANINQFIINPISIPELAKEKKFLAHQTLRLIANHSGYQMIWQEQMGKEWHETASKLNWPVISREDARWDVRATIDAVVAEAYGLTREQYQHVLASFNHKSFNKAPVVCLEKFDELQQIGLEAFSRKYDPYWDVPMVETLPIPVIELPVDVQVVTPASRLHMYRPVTVPPPALPVAWTKNTRQAAVTAWMIQRSAKQTGKYGLSGLRAEKNAYFLERTGKTSLELDFQAFPQGPFDSDFIYFAGDYANRMDWWQPKGNNPVAKLKVNAGATQGKQILPDPQAAELLLTGLDQLSDEQIGGLATVDFVCRKLSERNIEIAATNIRTFFDTDWKTKIGNPWFTDGNIQWALDKLVEMGLMRLEETPAGEGPTDLFGNPLPVNLFGEVVTEGRKSRKTTRHI